MSNVGRLTIAQTEIDISRTVSHQWDKTMFTRAAEEESSDVEEMDTSECRWCWFYLAECGVWHIFEVDPSAACSVTSDQIEQNYARNHQGILEFHTAKYTYRLDFSVMKQTNLTTGKQRPIKRALHSATSFRFICDNLALPVPSHWERINTEEPYQEEGPAEKDQTNGRGREDALPRDGPQQRSGHLHLQLRLEVDRESWRRLRQRELFCERRQVLEQVLPLHRETQLHPAEAWPGSAHVPKRAAVQVHVPGAGSGGRVHRGTPPVQPTPLQRHDHHKLLRQLRGRHREPQDLRDLRQQPGVPGVFNRVLLTRSSGRALRSTCFTSRSMELFS
ncbi:uncharacterized protein LOC133119062 isoform X2 [Conger conger]|uniref:uncharacterized protein LOC133119062 isoform X2 n=1 Tax=Conger conger TaxID=82655 RepID=UPI002A5A6B0C|nr:uncharacterized protein LOC133119062 isoform X2 [Conger conger]